MHHNLLVVFHLHLVFTLLHVHPRMQLSFAQAFSLVYTFISLWHQPEEVQERGELRFLKQALSLAHNAHINLQIRITAFQIRSIKLEQLLIRICSNVHKYIHMCTRYIQVTYILYKFVYLLQVCNIMFAHCKVFLGYFISDKGVNSSLPYIHTQLHCNQKQIYNTSPKHNSERDSVYDNILLSTISHPKQSLFYSSTHRLTSIGLVLNRCPLFMKGKIN